MARGAQRRRLRLDVTGAVQGVGFRPFVHRLACDEGLGGFVRNTGAGARLEIEGAEAAIGRFLSRLDAELKPPANIRARQSAWLAPAGEERFAIAPSAADGDRPASVLPDLATCPDCLAEILDPTNRRFRYPFTTCTHCGPRYSIIECAPYDRARTTMRRFPMCAACETEYRDPRSRRFHAETNACANCGPGLALMDAGSNSVAAGDSALLAAADALRGGRIVAMKGLGGFQLLVDARNAAAVARLRERKRRPAKPFAIMVATLDDASALAVVGECETRMLASAVAPIVLLKARDGIDAIAPGVAPGVGRLGIMLPTTPLHHILMRDLGFAIVATSANPGDEPIVFDEREALERLAGIAELFLVHDRPILRPVDDSVAIAIAGQETVLRHARGYAPQHFAAPSGAPCLALGGHQKAALAVADGDDIILGPHIGDLESAETRRALGRAVDGIRALYRQAPGRVACDAHPDYYTSSLARGAGRGERTSVPHHLAHVLACALDNGLDGPLLGVAWDGSGYGGDGSVWGGEFLAIDERGWRRAAHLRPFRLPGGEAAVREPRRAALGALHAVFGPAAFDMCDLPPVASFQPAEHGVLRQMLERRLNAPQTSSAGRLFDAVAAILGLCERSSFEGEAAMALECAADRAGASLALPEIPLEAEAGPLVVDWRPVLAAIVEARRNGEPAGSLAAAFHAALAHSIVSVAREIGLRRVLLTGGCFQNARLAERTIEALNEAGFEPHWHHRIPPNDGGLAAGQAVFAARALIAEAA